MTEEEIGGGFRGNNTRSSVLIGVDLDGVKRFNGLKKRTMNFGSSKSLGFDAELKFDSKRMGKRSIRGRRR